MSTTISPAASLKDRRLASLRLLDGHRVCLRFRDAFIGELDLLPWLEANRAPMNDSLLEESFFKQVFLDDGVLTWPNGFDLDPDTVRAWAEQGFCGPV